MRCVNQGFEACPDQSVHRSTLLRRRHTWGSSSCPSMTSRADRGARLGSSGHTSTTRAGRVRLAAYLERRSDIVVCRAGNPRRSGWQRKAAAGSTKKCVSWCATFGHELGEDGPGAAVVGQHADVIQVMCEFVASCLQQWLQLSTAAVGGQGKRSAIVCKR